MNNHLDFLLMVEGYVEKHPDVTPYVSDGVARGLEKARAAAQSRQAGLEIALSLQIGRSTKVHPLVIESLRRIEGYSHLDWRETLEKLSKAKEAGDV